MEMKLANNHPEQEPEAFLLWATNGRSIPKVVEDMQIPRRTVYSWASRYNWRGRYREMQLQVAQDSLSQASAELAVGLSTAAQRLIAMIQDDSLSSAEQRENIKLLYALATSPFQHEANSPQQLTLIDARQVTTASAEPKPITTEDLRKEATKAIEAHVLNNRPEKSKRNSFR